jgi:photosystem II stability/assembly factor-like uncharacterized protein
MRGFLALSLLMIACSSRSTVQLDRPGPVWPDLRPDRPARDHRLLEARRPDAAPGDRPRADVWPYDFRPEAPPAPPWDLVKLLTADDLHDVACVAGHVFVVGAQGTILHRGPTDTAFNLQLPPTQATQTAELYTVSFADTSYGVAGGHDAQIWQTKDLGASWTIAPQCSAYIFDTFYSLHLGAADQGFAAGVAVGGSGGTKYFNPPGVSWVCSMPFAGTVFYDVFRSGDRGWVVGDTGGPITQIYRTEDQGLTWAPVAAGTSSILRGIWFIGPWIGVAVGDGGTIVRSTDGDGKVWATVKSPTSGALHDIFFWDALNGWVVGAGGTILHSGDGGATWSAQKTASSARLEGVCFTSANDGWAVGEKGILLHTTTGGQ